MGIRGPKSFLIVRLHRSAVMQEHVFFHGAQHKALVSAEMYRVRTAMCHLCVCLAYFARTCKLHAQGATLRSHPLHLSTVNE